MKLMLNEPNFTLLRFPCNSIWIYAGEICYACANQTFLHRVGFELQKLERQNHGLLWDLNPSWTLNGSRSALPLRYALVNFLRSSWHLVRLKYPLRILWNVRCMFSFVHDFFSEQKRHKKKSMLSLLYGFSLLLFQFHYVFFLLPVLILHTSRMLPFLLQAVSTDSGRALHWVSNSVFQVRTPWFMFFQPRVSCTVDH